MTTPQTMRSLGRMQTRPIRTITTVRVVVAVIRMRTVAEATRTQLGNGTKREIVAKVREGKAV